MDDGVADSDGDNCTSWYNHYPEDCGKYDDADFFADQMCCGCKKFGKLAQLFHIDFSHPSNDKSIIVAIRKHNCL